MKFKTMKFLLKGWEATQQNFPPAKISCYAVCNSCWYGVSAGSSHNMVCGQLYIIERLSNMFPFIYKIVVQTYDILPMHALGK